MDYMKFYGDLWEFHRKYQSSLIKCANQEERNMVCKMLVDEGNALYDQYGTDFAMDLTIDVIKELDRTERKLRNGDK